MQISEFPEQTCIVPSTIEGCCPTPVFVVPNDTEGKVVACWQMNIAERLYLLFTGRLWLVVWTMGKLVPPMAQTVLKPVMQKETFHA